MALLAGSAFPEGLHPKGGLSGVSGPLSATETPGRSGFLKQLAGFIVIRRETKTPMTEEQYD